MTRGSDRSARLARIDEANRLLEHISRFGRRFFHDRASGRVARFETDADGRLRFRDDYTDHPVYVAYGGRWRHFSHGGTLRGLVEGLANYIRTGKPIPSGHFGPWPDHYCRGDLWGYGKQEMEKLRLAARGCACVAWTQNRRDVRKASSAPDAEPSNEPEHEKHENRPEP